MKIFVRGAGGLGAAAGVLDAGPFTLLSMVQSTGLDGSRHVLYLVPQHTLASARGQAHVLLARHPEAYVCVLGSNHHPLTLALVGSLLGDLGRNGGWSNPGHGVQLAHQALAGSRSLIWHRRLTGLAQPQPKPGQRWMSVLPGNGYLTELGDDLVRPRPEQLELRPEELLFLAGEPPPQLAAALAGVRTQTVDVQTELSAPYRGRGAVEMTAMLPLWPNNPSGLLCQTCGAYQVGDWCAFCNQHSSATVVPPRIPHGNRVAAVRV